MNVAVTPNDPLAQLQLKVGLGIAVATEAIILWYCYETYFSTAEVFRHAARYSGRCSLLVYLFCFYYFANGYQPGKFPLEGTRKLVIIFCVMHFIHLGFLLLNIYLNKIPLVPVKLAGGFIAYLMILVYPLLVTRVGAPRLLHLVYFYYVGVVMALTYVARIRGDFILITFW